MVQFNLLPDVKIQFIKARRTKRLMTLVSIVVIGISLFVFVLMLITVNVIQKKSLSDLNRDITTKSAQLKGISDLDKILTVQNQLSTLTELHDKKPVTTRLFGYLSQVTPENISLNDISIDFVQSTMIITGTAPSLDGVNLYTDTLKTTKYVTPDSSEKKAAFSGVVLASFARTDKGASFSITTTFDPLIFNSAQDVKLNIPAGPRTDPATLFQKESN